VANCVNPADKCVSVVCDAVANKCVTTNTVCPSADACTEFHCDSTTGVCGTAAFDVDCDDSNACTTDYCDATQGGCVHDARICPSTGDKCQNEFPCDITNGECAVGQVTCDDQIDCTDDTCNSDSGCVFTSNDANCVNIDPCVAPNSGKCDVPTAECV